MVLIASVFALSACSEPAQETAGSPRPAEEGDLLVAQLYTTGAPEAGGADHYYSDQFIELVNASEDTLELEGLRIADVFGAAGAINAGMTPDSYRESHPDQVVLLSVWEIPFAELAPGETLVIAQDGANHRPFSAVDLSGADFEAFVADSPQDQDSPTVENLESLVYNGGYDWLMTVFGPSVVLLDADTPLEDFPDTPYGVLPSVATDGVWDGVDTVMDGDSLAFKRLPDSVDRGAAWADGPYSGTSLHRLQVDGVWQDSDDSSADFFLGEPLAQRPGDSAGVFGEPQVSLGTGTESWAPLEEGDTVELVAGPQGGWHVDTALWFDGFGPDGVQLVYDAVDTEGELLSFVTQATLVGGSVLEAEQGWIRLGDRVVMDVEAPSEVVGQELILRVSASLDGQSWTDTRRVLVVDEE